MNEWMYECRVEWRNNQTDKGARIDATRKELKIFPFGKWVNHFGIVIYHGKISRLNGHLYNEFSLGLFEDILSITFTFDSNSIHIPVMRNILYKSQIESLKTWSSWCKWTFGGWGTFLRKERSSYLQTAEIKQN